jgi:hypothetical protein
MYEKMASPPEPGTLMESLILLVWRARQEIQMQQTRALVHAVTAAAAGEGNEKEATDQLHKAWSDYLDELFPFQKGKRSNADNAAMGALQRELKRGPLSVTPLRSLSGGSKLRKRRSPPPPPEESKPRYRRRRRGR